MSETAARMHGANTLTPGRIVGRLPDGKPDIEWGVPKTRKLCETMVVSRKYLAGKFEPWKIFGFQSLKGTREELEAWREEQDKIPEMPGTTKRKTGAAAVS